ncbi:MarR family winged helix-turn-helix transcriptional regulator, partial [Olsenella profusa]
MEEALTYEELAQELLGELTRLGTTLTPVMVNATRGETAVLMTLYRADGSLTPGQLGAHAHVSSARVANILRSLEEKGLVTRAHAAGDRRQVQVTLTEAGRSAAQSKRAERTRAVAGYLAELGEKDAAELVRIVRRSADVMHDRVARAAAAREVAPGDAPATAPRT